MTHREAKEILKDYTLDKRSFYDHKLFMKAIDVAIQCLEDSIEDKEDNEKLKKQTGDDLYIG